MEVRYAASPQETRNMSTAQLRDNYLIEDLFVPNQLQMVYSHVDRMITGGAYPIDSTIRLEADAKEMGAAYFLERREIGVINIGNRGFINVDGTEYTLETRDCLYVGLGNKEITFRSESADRPAKFYFNSAPAHKTYPTVKVDISQAEPNHLGTPKSSNERTIYKYIHTDGVQSCQLVLGLTLLKPNNMWNTMPCHTHNRRSEVYLYGELSDDSVVVHLMGEPDETRHLIVRNEQAVISPSWSIHSGVGTSSYFFIWGMVGENQTFSDMDAVEMQSLK